MKERQYHAWLKGSVCSLLIGAASLSSMASAQAQDQTADQAEETLAEEIIITGSRIKRAGFDTLQPAVNVDSEFLDERGFGNIADALNELPAFGNPVSNSGQQNGQSIGQNFVNAFGLGTQRTLTLINGRRTVGQNTPSAVGSGASAGLQVDLNIIPTVLVDRVETVFVGGAPIYGTDAIAGTVNIILKDDFEGFSADAQYGIDQRGDSENFRIRGIWGANTGDGRGNVVLSAEYNTVNGVDARDNDLLARQYGFCENTELGFRSNGLPLTVPDDGIPDFLPCEDSANVWQVPNSGLPLIGATAGATGAGALLDNEGNPLVFDADGNLITWEQARLGTPRSIFFSQGADGFNNPLVIGLDETNTLIAPLDRWIINGKGRYEVGERTNVFLEAFYARSESVDTNNQPPFGTAFFRSSSQGEIRINLAENPFITEQLRNTLTSNFDRIDAERQAAAAAAGDPDSFTPIDRSGFNVSRSNIDLVQGAPNFRSQDVFRFVSGFDGTVDFFGSEWNWDTAFIFGETNSLARQSNLNVRRYALALDAITDPETGQAVCRATVEGIETPTGNALPTSTDPASRDIAGCFALNPFGLRDLTPEQRDYLVQQDFQSTKIRQLVYEANFSGDLIELPVGPLSLAGGFAHRREQGRFQGDTNSVTGGLGTNEPTSNVRGKFNTTEIYGETLIPIIEDGKGLPFDVPFIASMQIEAALRFVDNNRAGNDVTWTAGGRLRPDLPFLEDSLTIRGNFTRSIRAPSIPELFQPTTSTTTFAADPCDPRNIGSGPNPAVRQANCEAQVAGLIASGVLPQDFDLDSFVSLIINRSDRSFTGGNPDLRNEKADSWTVGAVFTPNFLPGFSLSVDWTRIQLQDAITQLSATQLLAACFDSTEFPNVEACSQFERDAEFQIRNPTTNFLNAASRDFAGLVANVSYKFDGDALHDSIPGAFEVFGNFFHTARQDTIVSGGDLDIAAGERFNEKFQFQLNLRYNLDRFGFLWQTRHSGSFILNRQERDDIRPDEDKKVAPIRIHNLTLNYQLTDHFGIRTVVNNVLDKRDSPERLRARGGNALDTSDIIGRRFLFAVTADF